MIRAYERAMRITDQTEDIISQNKKKMNEWQRLIDDSTELMETMGKNPDDIAGRIEIMERIIDLETKKLKHQSETAKLIPQINSQVKELLELKLAVDKDRLQLESSDNKDAISNYIIDEFIDKHL